MIFLEDVSSDVIDFNLILWNLKNPNDYKPDANYVYDIEIINYAELVMVGFAYDITGFLIDPP